MTGQGEAPTARPMLALSLNELAMVIWALRLFRRQLREDMPGESLAGEAELVHLHLERHHIALAEWIEQGRQANDPPDDSPF